MRNFWHFFDCSSHSSNNFDVRWRLRSERKTIDVLCVCLVSLNDWPISPSDLLNWSYSSSHRCSLASAFFDKSKFDRVNGERPVRIRSVGRSPLDLLRQRSGGERKDETMSRLDPFRLTLSENIDEFGLLNFHSVQQFRPFVQIDRQRKLVGFFSAFLRFVRSSMIFVRSRKFVFFTTINPAQHHFNDNEVETTTEKKKRRTETILRWLVEQIFLSVEFRSLVVWEKISEFPLEFSSSCREKSARHWSNDRVHRSSDTIVEFQLIFVRCAQKIFSKDFRSLKASMQRLRMFDQIDFLSVLRQIQPEAFHRQ